MNEFLPPNATQQMHMWLGAGSLVGALLMVAAAIAINKSHKMRNIRRRKGE